MLSRLAILTTLVGLAAAAPAKRQSITTISSSQIASYTPYTWYAAAAYCAASETSSWSCGANCQANPSFQPVASGGDGTDIQYWYVGWDPAQSTVIVAHQGTDPTSFEADLTDGKFELETLDSSLFPGVSSSVEVHDGFAEEQAQ
ncbi:hypothetical protein BC834DRAFT_974875 [Gloeopeniophorella convolvens]|nr:hypothetical protein BC834DRAFT_974875 [Gloeopeniophorella convolvens]